MVSSNDENRQKIKLVHFFYHKICVCRLFLVSLHRFWKWPNFKTTSNILQNKFKPSSKALQKHFKYRVLWVQRYKIFLNYANFLCSFLKPFLCENNKKITSKCADDPWGREDRKWSNRTTNWCFVEPIKLQRKMELCKILCNRKRLKMRAWRNRGSVQIGPKTEPYTNLIRTLYEPYTNQKFVENLSLKW